MKRPLDVPSDVFTARRLLHLKQGLTIRRDMIPDDWVLRFAGPEGSVDGVDAPS